MNEPKVIERGALHFRRVDSIGHDRRYQGVVVECWLGPPDDRESEHVFTVDQTYVPDIIAGLRALEPRKMKRP